MSINTGQLSQFCLRDTKVLCKCPCRYNAIVEIELCGRNLSLYSSAHLCPVGRATFDKKPLQLRQLRGLLSNLRVSVGHHFSFAIALSAISFLFAFFTYFRASPGFEWPRKVMISHSVPPASASFVAPALRNPCAVQGTPASLHCFSNQLPNNSVV